MSAPFPCTELEIRLMHTLGLPNLLSSKEKANKPFEVLAVILWLKD